MYVYFDLYIEKSNEDEVHNINQQAKNRRRGREKKKKMPELHVRAVCARNLLDKQTFGKQDPFCKITVRSRTFKTRVHDNGGAFVRRECRYLSLQLRNEAHALSPFLSRACIVRPCRQGASVERALHVRDVRSAARPAAHRGQGQELHGQVSECGYISLVLGYHQYGELTNNPLSFYIPTARSLANAASRSTCFCTATWWTSGTRSTMAASALVRSTCASSSSGRACRAERLEKPPLHRMRRRKRIQLLRQFTQLLKVSFDS